MLTIAMAGEKQISLSSLWAERLNDEHIPFCLGMTANNVKTIR